MSSELEPGDGYQPGDPAYTRVALALLLGGLAAFATIYCTQPLLPLIAAHFGLAPAQSALSVSATTITLGLALLCYGPLSDALGRTRLMAGSLTASSMLTIITAFAPTWPVLLGLRLTLGLAVAGLPAVAVAYLRDEVAPGAVGRAVGLYIGGTALGGMSGRLVCGVVADLWGWRTAILAVGLVALLCTVIVGLLLPPQRNFCPVPLNPRALTTMAVRMVSDPGLLALYAIAFVTMGAFVGVFNAMGFRLTHAPYHLSVGVAGLVFVVYAVGSVSSSLAGHQADAYGARRVVPAWLGVMAAGLLLTLAQPLWLVIAGLAVFTAGFFAAHGVASGWVAGRASARGPGTAQATSLYLFGYYLGSSVCGAAATWAWTHDGWRGVVSLAGALIAGALLLTATLARIPSLAEPKAADPGIVAS